MAGQLRPHDGLVYVKKELMRLVDIQSVAKFWLILTKACLKRRIHRWWWDVDTAVRNLEISNREAVNLEFELRDVGRRLTDRA